MAHLGQRWSNILAKLVKFIVVGSSGVVVNTIALFVLYEMVGFHLLIASATAVELAIINNYVWNNWWTFERSAFSITGFAKFNLVSVGGLAITTGTLYMLVTSMAVNYLLANLVGIALATVWNFGLNFLWTWGAET